MYEYTMGTFINANFNKVFPCFVETYGLYKYKNEGEWDSAQNGLMELEDNVNASVTKIDNLDYAESCRDSKHLCVLIQHIKNAQTMNHHNRSVDIVYFQQHELYALYQVYYTLSMLSDMFTHYDLHDGNVMLYEPVNGKYIQYHFHINGEIVSFKSIYIAKIIDYGRVFIANESKNIYDKVCNERDCDPNCGDNLGFTWLEAPPTELNSYICAQVRNKSHDLRLLDLCKKRRLHETFPELYSITSKIVFTEDYGTKEKLNTGLPAKIHNVMDAEKELRALVKRADARNTNFYAGKEKLGDLYIYGNAPMTFVPV